MFIRSVLRWTRDCRGNCWNSSVLRLPLGREKVFQIGLYVAHGASGVGKQLHLHALLMEAMSAPQHQVIVPFLDKPFADVAGFIRGDASVIDGVVLCLDYEVHLIDPFWLESLRRGFGHRNSLLCWFCRSLGCLHFDFLGSGRSTC